MMVRTNLPQPTAVLELLKPVTWFPPMWAFGCGVVCAGPVAAGRWPAIALGVVLAGPLVCAASQAVNDWFDRHVDAINEPHRPIPSGRMPGLWGLHVAVAWTALSLLAAAMLESLVLAAAAVGLALAWAYSAPPFRLKQNGWWGNAACGICYEGLAWLTGTMVASGGAAPASSVIWLAMLYSAGAHGIMTLNDFKSIEGDRRMGIGSLPVRLGPVAAGRVACLFMTAPQAAVVALLIVWNAPLHAAAVAGLLVVQIALMRRLLASPRERAPWYNATGVSLFVLGMLVSAFAVRSGA
ncbi:MAG: chlorophyll synthase ChlG [Reyranellaceae bacterium]